MPADTLFAGALCSTCTCCYMNRTIVWVQGRCYESALEIKGSQQEHYISFGAFASSLFRYKYLYGKFYGKRFLHGTAVGTKMAPNIVSTSVVSLEIPFIQGRALKPLACIAGDSYWTTYLRHGATIREAFLGLYDISTRSVHQ